MAIITITSDYGEKDHYIAALKGVLHREMESPIIVDVSHLIASFDLFEAAFLLGNAYKHFPTGSIHLICVEEEATANRKHLVAKIDGHYFIAADNGVIAMINPELKPDFVFEIDLRNTPAITSARDVFARAAGHLHRGGKAELLGQPMREFKKVSINKPTLREEGKLMIGTVIYIDKFGNLVTNVSKKIWKEAAKGRNFKIVMPKSRKAIVKLHKNYHDSAVEGRAIAIFNAASLLEIAIFKSGTDTYGGAAELLGIRKNDKINIEFL